MSSGFFNFIKSNVDVVQVIQDFTTLKRIGNYLKGKCPFHHERTASFTVSPNKGIFYCFGCQVGGDVLSFIEKIEHCTPRDAAEYLIKKYQLTVPTEYTENWKKTDQKSVIEENTYHLFIAWCRAQLGTNRNAQNYLSSRGFSQASIELFQVGYFPPHSIANLLSYMREHNMILQNLIEAKLLTAHKNIIYSAFEDRILFPIYDHIGNVVGFGGRLLTYNNEDPTKPKYYNSPEHSNFSKGSTLFGLDKAKKYIQKTGSVFLVEGYTDCISMVQYGYHNTVATLGTACTNNHLKLLARYTECLYVLYDGDKAGQEATLRLTQLCWQSGIELRVVRLPDGHDPASFLLAKGNLDEYISSSVDIFSYYISYIGNAFDKSPMHQKIKLVKKMLEIIATIEAPLTQDLLLQQAAKTYAIPFETLKQELRGHTTYKNTEENFHQDTLENPPKATNSYEGIGILEKKVVCAILNGMNITDMKHIVYTVNYMPEPVRNIVGKFLEHSLTSRKTKFIDIFSTLDAQEQSYISALLLSQEDQAISREDFCYLVKQLQKKYWKSIVAEIKKQITVAETQKNREKVASLMHDFLLLKSEIFSPDTSSN